MIGTLQEFDGISRMLDRLEERISAYRKLLRNMSLDIPDDGDIEKLGITDGEVESVEELILSLSHRIVGEDPDPKVWERMKPYCSKNEDKVDGWAAQNTEFFRWALLWVQKTRNHLEYLVGAGQAAPVGPSRSIQDSPTNDDSGPAYDVALSFADEDRVYARQLAQLIKESGHTVFYDEYEQARMWGVDLYTHLSDVYKNRARFCVIFASENYARKLWTRKEREAAQARAFRDSEAYILPVRIDDTPIPGLEETTGYLDLRKQSIDDVFTDLLIKLRS